MIDRSIKTLDLRPLPSLWTPLITGLAVAFLASSLSGPSLLLLLAAGGGALIFLRFPETALAVFLVIGVFKAEPTLAGLTRGLDLTLYFAALAWISIIYRLFKRKDALPREVASLLPALLLIGLMSISLIDPANFAYALDKAGRFTLLTFLAFIAPSFLLATRQEFERFAKISVVLGLVVAASVIRAWLANPDILIRIMGSQYLSLGRVAGSGAIIAGFLLVSSRSRVWKSISFSQIPLGAWAVLASGGRGPTLALILSPIFAGLVATVLRGWKKAARFLLPGIALLLIVAALYSLNLLPSVIQQRLALALNPVSTGAPADNSLTFRFTLFSFAWEMIREYPLMGVGLGAFSVASGPAMFLPARAYPHNIFLELGAELGLLGLILFTVLLLLAIAKLMSTLSTTTENAIRTATATGLVLLTYALLNASISGNVNDNKLLWFAMGLPYALASWSTTRLNLYEDGLDEQT